MGKLFGSTKDDKQMAKKAELTYDELLEQRDKLKKSLQKLSHTPRSNEEEILKKQIEKQIRNINSHIITERNRASKEHWKKEREKMRENSKADALKRAKKKANEPPEPPKKSLEQLTKEALKRGLGKISKKKQYLPADIQGLTQPTERVHKMPEPQPQAIEYKGELDFETIVQYVNNSQQFLIKPNRQRITDKREFIVTDSHGNPIRSFITVDKHGRPQYMYYAPYGRVRSFYKIKIRKSQK